MKITMNKISRISAIALAFGMVCMPAQAMWFSKGVQAVKNYPILTGLAAAGALYGIYMMWPTAQKQEQKVLDQKESREFLIDNTEIIEGLLKQKNTLEDLLDPKDKDIVEKILGQKDNLQTLMDNTEVIEELLKQKDALEKVLENKDCINFLIDNKDFFNALMNQKEEIKIEPQVDTSVKQENIVQETDPIQKLQNKIDRHLQVKQEALIKELENAQKNSKNEDPNILKQDTLEKQKQFELLKNDANELEQDLQNAKLKYQSDGSKKEVLKKLEHDVTTHKIDTAAGSFFTDQQLKLANFLCCEKGWSDLLAKKPSDKKLEFFKAKKEKMVSTKDTNITSYDQEWLTLTTQLPAIKNTKIIMTQYEQNKKQVLECYKVTIERFKELSHSIE